MNAELKQKWVEELESDNWKQGKSCLKSSSGEYCCLGVLAEILHREHPGEYEWTRENGFRKCSMVYSSRFYLEGQIGPDIGLLPGSQATLGRMNDSGKTFKEIAAYIRESH